MSGYIFLDESGDLGFDFTRKYTSKYFVITFLFIRGSKGPIEKVIKKSHEELAKKFRRKVGVLHAVHEKPATRERVLRRIAEKDCSVMVIYLSKERVRTQLKDEKQILYNYVANILLDRVYTKRLLDPDEPIELVTSRRETNIFLNANFERYISSQTISQHGAKIAVRIKSPYEEKCLQAVDFLSWAVFRKYERNDSQYYDLFASKIVEENGLFT